MRQLLHRFYGSLACKILLYSLPVLILVGAGWYFINHGYPHVPSPKKASLSTASYISPACLAKQNTARAERYPLEQQRAIVNDKINLISAKGAGRAAAGNYDSPPGLTAKERVEMDALMLEYMTIGNLIDDVNAKHACTENDK